MCQKRDTEQLEPYGAEQALAQLSLLLVKSWIGDRAAACVQPVTVSTTTSSVATLHLQSGSSRDT